MRYIYNKVKKYPQMKILRLIVALMLPMAAHAQYAWQDGAEAGRLDLSRDASWQVEMQGGYAKGKTPLWLNANRYGLSTLDRGNGYLRASVVRPLQADSARRWGVGYGLDLVGGVNYGTNPIVQQAYAEVRWLHGVLTVGSKEYGMELKNNRLSSGSQTLGINARPVPQVRLALPEYWTLPFGGGWLQLKGHIAYGMMTDDNWQHDFTGCQRDYTHQQHIFTDNVLYHSKAGYLRIGKDEDLYPLSLELGLEMGAQFGGTAYMPQKDGTIQTKKGNTGLRSFWNAFIPGGGDVGEGEYANVEGNQLGSWLMRINYNADTWRLRLYADHFFEDHSGMFMLDYDGYGEGDEYMVKKDRRFYMYDLKDIMLGAELNLKYCSWLHNVVVEYLYTKYQSGPLYHDHTMNIPDHIAGNDDYYNHGTYPGWQHWGQVMGNPLYRSPIYNDNGRIHVENNRFMAFHLGVDGNVTRTIDYRLLATWQDGLGTYDRPYLKKRHNVSFLVEAGCRLKHNWQLRGGYAMDFGSILGHNAGVQFTLSKGGLLEKNTKKRR